MLSLEFLCDVRCDLLAIWYALSPFNIAFYSEYVRWSFNTWLIGSLNEFAICLFSSIELCSSETSFSSVFCVVYLFGKSCNESLMLVAILSILVGRILLIEGFPFSFVVGLKLLVCC